MSEKNKYSQIIANYLYNDMSQEERLHFEKDLLVNEELAAEFELQSSAVKYLKARLTLEDMMSDPDLAEAEKLAEEILSEENDVENSNTDKEKIVKRHIDRKVFVRILAAAVILIGVISTTLIVSSGSTQSLYRLNYEPFDETSLTYRGGGESLDENITYGIRLYTSESYNESVELFQNIQISNPGNPLATFYLGLSHMGISDFNKAIDLFEQHSNSFEVYLPEVKWYLALCYLKTDKIDESYQLFQDLSTYPGKYGKNSKKIAKKLENKLGK